MDLILDSCRSRYFLGQIETSVRPKEVFRCVVTVRRIHKLSISSICSGCDSAVVGGACTYGGCHWNNKSRGFKVLLKAW